MKALGTNTLSKIVLKTFKKNYLDINHLHIFLKCKSICHTDLYIYQNLFIIILKYYVQSGFILKWDKHYQNTYYLGEEFNYQSLSDETFIKEVSFRDNDVFHWWWKTNANLGFSVFDWKLNTSLSYRCSFFIWYIYTSFYLEIWSSEAMNEQRFLSWTSQ